MADEHDKTIVDQDAEPPSDGATDQEGPHPDPPLDGQQVDDKADDEGDGTADDGDEGSKLSFPTSDPPATWAGTDRPV